MLQRSAMVSCRRDLRATSPCEAWAGAGMPASVAPGCSTRGGAACYWVALFLIGKKILHILQSQDGPTVLYDAGDSPAKIMAHLDRLAVNRVDLVIASHNHADHIGGMAEVVKRFHPRFYMDNGVPATTATYRAASTRLRSIRNPAPSAVCQRYWPRQPCRDVCLPAGYSRLGTEQQRGGCSGEGGWLPPFTCRRRGAAGVGLVASSAA